jgi:hypothetical protein|nr:MAG TPA: hypothetical protein [Caudoviricetes sp.]
MVKFTQLPDKLIYPARIRAKLSTLHSDVITYVVSNFKNTAKYKRQVVDTLNTISVYIKNNDALPSDWSVSNPLTNLELLDSSFCEDTLGNLCIKVKDIIWDVQESETDEQISTDTVVTAKTSSEDTVTSSKVVNVKPKRDIGVVVSPTPKENLYIKPPTIPQFDASKPWLQSQLNQNVYTIYESLPIIPVNQSQISVTTDVSKMTIMDMMKLYPNHFIRTRAATMYENHNGLTLDDDIGIILPIVGFSPTQVKDNIIKYPHIYKLTRYMNNKFTSFYSNIEIDGELHDTLSIWDSLPDSKKMPRNSEFIKEYVVRRYLLERDILGVEHKYPLFGTLEPFLTLFTTSDDYIRLGYTDVTDIAKQCVISRVSYKRSRNPILRMVYNE